MSDRHLCKAKRIDDGEWVEGYYFCMVHTDGRHAHHFIIPLGADLSLGTPIDKIQVEVNPTTLCYCTGLKDKNGKLIWENDIVKCGKDVFMVKWNKKYAGCCLRKKGWLYDHFFGEACNPKDCEVIGNIFDDLSLLKGGAE